MYLIDGDWTYDHLHFKNGEELLQVQTRYHHNFYKKLGN